MSTKRKDDNQNLKDTETGAVTENDGNLASDAPKDVQSHKCNACGDTFSDLDELINHLSVHTESDEPKKGDVIDLTDDPQGKVKKETKDVGDPDCFVNTPGEDTIGYENPIQNALQNGSDQPGLPQAEESWETTLDFAQQIIQSDQILNPHWEQSMAEPQAGTGFNYSQYIQSDNYGHNAMTPSMQQSQGFSHMMGGQQGYQPQGGQGFNQYQYPGQQGFTQNHNHQGFSQNYNQQGFTQHPYPAQQGYGQNHMQQGFGQNQMQQGYGQNQMRQGSGQNQFQQGFNQNSYPGQQGVGQNPNWQGVGHNQYAGQQDSRQNPYPYNNGNQSHPSAQNEYQSQMGTNMMRSGPESGNQVPSTHGQSFTGSVWGKGTVSQTQQGSTWQMTLNSETNPLKCTVCGLSFPQQSFLDSHMASHGGKEPYTCVVCGKSFQSKRAMSVHMNVHSGDTPHQCKTCGKGFRGKAQLQQHMISHSDERPFECVLCRKCYKTSGALASHMRSHTVQ